MRLRRNPLFIIALRYGSIAGVVMVLLLIGTFYIGQHPLLISPYFDFRIVLFGVFILFALKEFRDNVNYGVLHFFQGMIGSYMLVFIAAIIGSLGVLVFAALEKNFVSSYIEAMTAYLKGFSEEDIKTIGKAVYDRNLSLLPATNSRMLAVSYFGQGILIGLFVSIVLSVILRKQPKNQ